MTEFRVSRRAFTLGGAAVLGTAAMPALAEDKAPGVFCKLTFRGRSFAMGATKVSDGQWMLGLRDLETNEWIRTTIADVEPEQEFVRQTERVSIKVLETEDQLSLNGVQLFESRDKVRFAINDEGEEVCIEDPGAVNTPQPTGQGFWNKVGKVLGGIGKIIVGAIDVIVGIIDGDFLKIAKGVGSILSGVGTIIEVFSGGGNGVMIPPECMGPNPPSGCGTWLNWGDVR